MQHAGIVRPSAPDLDPDFEEHPTSEQRLHVQPGLSGDALHALAAGSQQDGLVRGFVHQHCGVDAPEFAFVDEAVDGDFGPVRHLFPGKPEDLLAYELGGKEPLRVTPNMLAKIFDRKAEFHSGYPQEVWDYLNAIPPTENVRETRRAQLLKAWTATGRIDTGNAPKVQEKIELLTSGVSRKKRLTIYLLNDRAAMLSDVRAKVSLMKRDLSKLMLALRAN